MRWILGAVLAASLHCSATSAHRSSPIIPLDSAVREEGQPLPTCPKHSVLSPLDIVRTPWGMAIRDPNEAPVFVTETHALREDGSIAIIVAYHEPVFVPAGKMVTLPKTSYLAGQLEGQVRVIYVDGWGHERVEEHPVPEEPPSGGWHSPSWRPVAANESCATPLPPSLVPLTFTHEPTEPVVACTRGCRCELAIRAHNPNPHRVRITDVWIDNPDGSATAPARRDGALHYVDAHGAALLPYDIALDHAGRHTLRVTYVDGWARRHLAQTDILVLATK